MVLAGLIPPVETRATLDTPGSFLAMPTIKFLNTNVDLLETPSALVVMMVGGGETTEIPVRVHLHQISNVGPRC